MGEPSGVASEILLKTWLLRRKKKLPPFFAIDSLKKLNHINNLFDLKVKFKLIEKPSDTNFFFADFLPVLDIKENFSFKLGKPNPSNGKIVINSIVKSFKFINSGEARAMVTLPVCKKTLKVSGFKFSGQTEFLSDLSEKIYKKKHDEIMILTTNKPVDNGKNLIVGLVTTHVPLKSIFKNISKNGLISKIFAFNNSLQTIWGINQPKIALASINPHSGEGGLIGEEEKKIIVPVIEKLNYEGLKLFGPLSSDSCFFKTIRKKYDGILCLYHDQGLAPIKILDFYNSVNVTGNLPILRVSPDHGPAFDIAKKNIAKTDSLVASIKFLEKFC